MAELIVCKKCNEREIFLKHRGMQVGAYCSNCGAWLKWVGKKELPYYTSRGLKILSENCQVTIKRDAPMGVIIEDTNNVKPTTFQKNVDSMDMPFDSVEPEDKDLVSWEKEYKNRVKNEELTSEKSSLSAEIEIEKRVKARLIVEKESIEEEIEKRVQERLKNHKPTETHEGYCSICDGQPLKPFKDADNNQVDVTVYDGVLTITNPDGSVMLGLYVINRCPECGKSYTKLEGAD